LIRFANALGRVPVQFDGMVFVVIVADTGRGRRRRHRWWHGDVDRGKSRGRRWRKSWRKRRKSWRKSWRKRRKSWRKRWRKSRRARSGGRESRNYNLFNSRLNFRFDVRFKA